MGNRILIIEDEREIAGFLMRGLSEEGFHVEAVASGTQGNEALQEAEWDVVILDWWLPGIDGLTLLRQHRKAGYQTAVLFLTARDAVSQRVEALNAGADDYLCKPFAFEELLARVKALSRRQNAKVSPLLVHRDVEINRLAQSAKRAGMPLDLRPKDFALLSFFVAHPQEVLSHSRIYEQVWGDPFDGSTNTLAVHIRELRRVLEAHGPPLIHTLRGQGYLFGDLQAPHQDDAP